MKANSKRKVFGDAVDLLMGDMEEVTMPRGVQMLPVKSIQPFHDHPFHLYEGERLDDIEKIWDYEQRIDAQINRLVDLRSEINAAIESMENPEERLLLKYRYLKNESWEDISYELNVSYRTVHRIHASALNNFIVPE